MARKMDIKEESGHKFQFTRNWFKTRNLATFREHIYPYWNGKPISYLELGCFEGMSLVWMLQHILTHEDSRAVALDPWLLTTKLDEFQMQAVYDRAIHNVKPWLGQNKCRLIRGCSSEVLRKMWRYGFAGTTKKTPAFDLIMIDGSHFHWLVLDDAEQSLRLLKPGGVLLFDDVENDHKKSDHVRSGLAMFLERHPMELVFKHKYVEAYRRIGEAPEELEEQEERDESEEEPAVVAKSTGSSMSWNGE